MAFALRSARASMLVQRTGGYLSAVNQARLIHLAPPQATAAGQAPKGEKKKPVGKQVLAARLVEAHPELKLKQANEIIDTLLDDIMLTVAEGEDVTIPGFGSFKKRHRPARKGRNPNSGEELNIPAKDAPAFSAGSVFKGVVQTGSWEAYDAWTAQQKAAKAKK